jgi:hypothetical protein
MSNLKTGSHEWKVGLARINITPKKSLWMAGYANRTKPSEGVVHDIHAKAMVLEDYLGKQAVLITTDLLLIPAAVSHKIADSVEKQHHLTRAQLLLSFSHNHGGPVVAKKLDLIYPMNAQQWADVEAYTEEFEDKIVQLVGEALKSLQPARLSFGRGAARFAINRRERLNGEIIIGVNKDGPVDHDVPVLRIDGMDGNLRAVVFGYACHCTTARDFNQFHGDYAGFAQAWLETQHPDATALFMAGCGADINPNPRGTIELARKYGEELGEAVGKVLCQKLQPVRGPLKTTYEEFPVAFATPPCREELQAELKNKDEYQLKRGEVVLGRQKAPSDIKDVYRRKWAEAMLEILDRDNHLPADYPCPLGIWQFGQDLTLIALAGEMVVDYDLRLKKELGVEKLWVASYCNDVFAYIPSLRVLQEGGYEGGGAMIYYCQPASFAQPIEETIIRKVHDSLQQARSESL